MSAALVWEEGGGSGLREAVAFQNPACRQLILRFRLQKARAVRASGGAIPTRRRGTRVARAAAWLSCTWKPSKTDEHSTTGHRITESQNSRGWKGPLGVI